MNLKKLPQEEKPRERLLKYGKNNVSNNELIEIILKSGTKRAWIKEISHNILSSVNVSFAERKQFEEVVEFYMKEKNSLDAVHNKINNQMRQASSGCAVITAGIFFLFFTIIFLGAKGICALV